MFFLLLVNNLDTRLDHIVKRNISNIFVFFCQLYIDAGLENSVSLRVFAICRLQQAAADCTANNIFTPPLVSLNLT